MFFQRETVGHAGDEVADALRSDISHSIMEQVATKILLPNPYGRETDYIDGLGLTHHEFSGKVEGDQIVGTVKVTPKERPAQTLPCSNGAP